MMKKKEKKIVRRLRKMQRVRPSPYGRRDRAAMSSAKVSAHGRIKRVLGDPCETNTYDDVHTLMKVALVITDFATG
jgi:hypothetical protein